MDADVQRILEQEELTEQQKKDRDEINKLMEEQMYGYRTAMNNTLKEIMDGGVNGREQDRQQGATNTKAV